MAVGKDVLEDEMTEERTIDSFRGEYFFLSNFSPAKIVLDEVEYPTTEHAFQAAKTLDTYARIKIKSAPEPGMAKRLGRTVVLRPDWEKIKVNVMLGLLHQKFRDHALADKLLATSDALLVEGNNWGDTFWGSVNGVGYNMLGILLHIVRYELRIGELVPRSISNSEVERLFHQETHKHLRSLYRPDPDERPF